MKITHYSDYKISSYLQRRFKLLGLDLRMFRCKLLMFYFKLRMFRNNLLIFRNKVLIHYHQFRRAIFHRLLASELTKRGKKADENQNRLP